jgi:SAM-dependent methyltransferase
MMIKDSQDAFGHMMSDFLEGKLQTMPLTERDDNYIDIDRNPDYYFSTFDKWLPMEQKAMEYVTGRVLDVGCGAGRHTLYLQERGHEVVAIDNSPLVLEVARRRGVKDARLCSLTQINNKSGVFDTMIFMGTNFPLVGTLEKAQKILNKLTLITNHNARIIAQTLDPYETTNPDHLSYHAANRAAGRWSGQCKIRYRYRKYTTPWMDFLLTSKQELEILLKDTAWQVEKYLNEEMLLALYIAILKKRE